MSVKKLAEQGAATHTPGPWRVCELDAREVRAVCSASHARPLVMARAFAVDPERGSAEANARLIAAAPEMLEALELIRDHGLPPFAKEAVLNAIAKAKGQQDVVPVDTEYSTLTGLWFVYNAQGVIVSKFPLESQAREYIAKGGR